MKYAVEQAKRKWRGFGVQAVGAVGLLIVLLLVIGTPRPDAHAQTGDWSTFLGSNARTGFNGSETVINPTTAPNLKVHWTRQLLGGAGRISAEPVEANGMVYWGSWDGIEHASRLTDGTDVWATHLGQPSVDCVRDRKGVVSTATVTSLSIGGVTTPVVFVAGADVQMYALNANTGAILWHTPLGALPNVFLWSSPAVYGGSVYIGVSGDSDCAVSQGQMAQLDATTGAVQHIFDVVPSGCTGGSVWSSPTIDDATGMLYFSTAEARSCSSSETMAVALIELKASDLSLVGSWQVPAKKIVKDGDFGSTPTLFQASIGGVLHKMVGLVNKNGLYYAFDRTNISAGPLWQVLVSGTPAQGGDSVASSAWDGNTLYVAAGATTINGSTCPGSLRALNPTNGAFLWQICLSNLVYAAVTAVPGLVVVESGPSLYVVDATSGNQLFSFHDTNTTSYFWGPASISRGVLYQGNKDGRLYAFGM